MILAVIKSGLNLFCQERAGENLENGVGILDRIMMKMDRKRAGRGFLLAVALLCFLLLFVGGPGSHPSRTFYYGWGLGHLFSFALWGSLFLSWRKSGSAWRLSVEVMLLALLLGGATELLQAGLGREASWQDLGTDLLGAALSAVFAPGLKSQLHSKWVLGLRFLVLVPVVWIVIPFVKVAVDDLVARQQFPLLSGFETPFEVGRWGGPCRRQLDSAQVYSGNAALRVDLDTRRYAGIALKYFPADWSGYRWLRLHIYNPNSGPFPFYFRIHDQAHSASGNRYSDRFNTSFEVAPGWTRLEVDLEQVAAAPKGRRLDLTKVAGMNLFVAKLDEPFSFYLDEIELVP